jgi:hypothetical protein
VSGDRVPDHILEQTSLLADEAPPAPPEALAALIDEALELQGVIDSYEESLKAAKARFDLLRKTLIPDAMRHAKIVDASGHGKVSHHSGARIHLRHDLNAYVLAADKPSLIHWLKKEGHGDLVREEVHHSTLKAFCKERIENRATLPPQVKTSPETVAVITVPKSKGE